VSKQRVEADLAVAAVVEAGLAVAPAFATASNENFSAGWAARSDISFSQRWFLSSAPPREGKDVC